MRRSRKPEAGNQAAEADERTVRTAALALLAGRDFGRSELGQRLLRKGYPAALVEAAVARLEAEKLLNEARFTEQFIRQHAGRGHGPQRIRAELRERGVATADVDEALESAAIDWQEAARSTRRKRFGGRAPADFRERAKQARFLQYRGFTSDQIRAALGPGDEPGDDLHSL